MGEMSESETDSQSGSRVRFCNRGHDNASPGIGVMSSFDDLGYDNDYVEEQEIQFEAEAGVDDYPRSGDDSDVSSTIGSDATGYANESPYDYLDMTGDDYCRVIMTRQKDGVRIPCVCGNNRYSCARSGHLDKQGSVNKEGPPRFYIKLPGSRGVCDSRLDRVQLTRSEGERKIREGRDEMERMAAVLGSVTIGDDNSADEVESVTHLATATRNTASGFGISTPQVATNTNFVNRITKYVLGSNRTGGSLNATTPSINNLATGTESPPARKSQPLGNGPRNNRAPTTPRVFESEQHPNQVNRQERERSPSDEMPGLVCPSFVLADGTGERGTSIRSAPASTSRVTTSNRVPVGTSTRRPTINQDEGHEGFATRTGFNPTSRANNVTAVNPSPGTREATRGDVRGTTTVQRDLGNTTAAFTNANHGNTFRSDVSAPITNTRSRVEPTVVPGLTWLGLEHPHNGIRIYDLDLLLLQNVEGMLLNVIQHSRGGSTLDSGDGCDSGTSN